MKGQVEINPYQKYKWIDLPKDASIEDITFNASKERAEIHYTSDSGEIYQSNGEFGFEVYAFSENEDVNVSLASQTESKKIVYAKLLDCKKYKIFIVISTWKKR